MHEEVGSWLNIIVQHLPAWAEPYVNLGVITSWVVLGLVVVLAWRSTRNLKLVAQSGWQTIGEWAYQLSASFCEGLIGPGGERFAPLIGSLFIYILIMNVTGLVPGFVSPTASLNMTLALAITALVAVQYYGFRERGWRYLLHFVGEPWWLFPLMIPIHLIGEAARLLSLSIRLFGNIFGKEVVIGQILILLGTLLAMNRLSVVLRVPAVISGVAIGHVPLLLLGLLVSLIQALIFAMLTGVYIQGAIATEHETG